MKAASDRQLTRRILLGVALGLVVAVGLMLYSDASALIECLTTQFDAWMLLPALGLSLVGYGIRIIKWEVYLRVLDIRLRRVDSALVFLAGLTMSITPGKVGEVLKSFLLKRSHGVAVSYSAPIVIAERITDLVALVILAGWGVFTSGYGTWVVVVAVVMVAVAMVLVAWPPAVRASLALAGRLPLLRRLGSRLERAYESMARLSAPRPLAIALVLSLLAWGGEAVGTWLILNAFPGVEVGLAEATFVYAFATVAGAVSMLPGGLVAAEGSMIFLLVSVFAIAPSTEVATAATLVVRFCTLWFGVLLGVLALAIFRRRDPGDSSGDDRVDTDSPDASPHPGV